MSLWGLDLQLALHLPRYWLDYQYDLKQGIPF